MEIKDLAAKIRGYVKTSHVARARKEGKKTFQLKAGDVQKELKLDKMDYSTICDVLSSPELAETCQIKHVRTEGPRMAPETTYTYNLGDLV
jgi:hypothetical protein